MTALSAINLKAQLHIQASQIKSFQHITVEEAHK